MTTKEKFTVSGSQLVDKVKQLIHEGNIRRVRVIHEGRTVIEIPLSILREMFSTDMKADCSHCGFTIYADLQSCIQWCKYAEKCLGEELYQKLKKGESD